MIGGEFILSPKIYITLESAGALQSNMMSMGQKLNTLNFSQSVLPLIKSITETQQILLPSGNFYKEHVQSIVDSMKLINSLPSRNFSETIANQFTSINKVLTDNNFQSVVSVISQIQRRNTTILHNIGKHDFRINVLSYQLENTIENNLNDCVDKLLFKDISEPTDKLESQLFDILNQQRKILDNHSDILNKINNTQSKNIPDKKSTDPHSLSPSYRNKEWYIEQFEASLISLFVGAIIEATIGTNPTNTIALVLLLSALLRFIGK